MYMCTCMHPSPNACYMYMYMYMHVINPQHKRKGYDSRSVCVCYHTICSYYIPCLYMCVEKLMSLSFLWHFQGMYCADFIENALLKSFGNIY